MKFKLKNLGALKQAEFELAPLTIICGRNNTGKTYATHATYGFLNYLHTAVEFPIDDKVVEQVFVDGVAKLNVEDYFDSLEELFADASSSYSKMLHQIFAGEEKHFKESTLELELDGPLKTARVSKRLQFANSSTTALRIESSEDLKYLEITLTKESNSTVLPPHGLVLSILQDAIREAVIIPSFPKPFISSAERTGAAIFQKELDFTRSRLREMLADHTEKITPWKFFGSAFGGEYPLAVRLNVDFIRDLSNIKSRTSFIAKEHPEILNSFADLVGGKYLVTKENEVRYSPANGKRTNLSLVESSSATRSLLDIGFYLHHIAQKGDLLMVDEPELNLHPENQRRVARLLAQLVNVGIKIFITTHSDYLIKELNTLILLNQTGDRFKKIAKRENYANNELLDNHKVRVYIAEKALGKLDCNKVKTTFMTLTKAEISQEQGIEVRSFDTTIDDMNRIQEEIVWGDDE